MDSIIKKYLNVDEQIKLLKERNLIISEESKFKWYLKNFGYYSIINRYNTFFLKKKGNQYNFYLDDISSNMILELFNFDRFLSTSFLRSILNLECKLNTIIFDEIFNFATNSKKINDYEKQNIINGNLFNISIPTINILFKEKYYRILNEIYKIKFDKKIIKKYRTNHCVPVWIFATQLNFGQIIKVLENVNSQIANNIRKRFCINNNLQNPNFLIILKLIKNVRNRICHSNVLYDINQELNRDNILKFIKSNKIFKNKKTKTIRFMDIVRMVDFLNKYSDKEKTFEKYLFKKIYSEKDTCFSKKINKKILDYMNIFEEDLKLG